MELPLTPLFSSNPSGRAMARGDGWSRHSMVLPGLSSWGPWAVWGAVVVLGASLLGIGAIGLSLVLAPWVEELLWRRGLHDSLRYRVSPFMAVTLVATGFAVAHLLALVLLPGPVHGLAVVASLATFVPAWLIGHAYQRHVHLGVCVAAHAGANLIWLLAWR